MNDKTYTMDEIMAAFEAIKRDLDANFGDGTADEGRFLIDDVATDVRNLLTDHTPWAAFAELIVGADDSLAAS